MCTAILIVRRLAIPQHLHNSPRNFGERVLYWFCELGDAAGIWARVTHEVFPAHSPVHPQQAKLTRLWTIRGENMITCNVCYGQDPYCKICSGKSEPPRVDQNSLVREIAKFIRECEVNQGDQYGVYVQVSPDAEQLARAVENEFLLLKEKP